MKRRLLHLLIILLLLAGLGISAGIYIAPKNELQRAKAIVAVSGGDTHSRTLEAVELYKEGWAPRLIFSGAAKDPDSISNAQAMRDIAVDQGVSPDAIIIDEFAVNTRQNAYRVATLVDLLEYDSIILVTSPYHQRRTYLEFRKVLDDDVKIVNHPAVDHEWSRSRWWQTPFGWRMTLSEIPKVIYALIQG